VARTDLSGRVRVASLLQVLGWLPGSGIDLDVADGAIVIRVGSDGRHKIGALGEIRLPASVRAMAGIATKSPVFMAATCRPGTARDPSGPRDHACAALDVHRADRGNRWRLTRPGLPWPAGFSTSSG